MHLIKTYVCYTATQVKPFQSSLCHDRKIAIFKAKESVSNVEITRMRNCYKAMYVYTATTVYYRQNFSHEVRK